MRQLILKDSEWLRGEHAWLNDIPTSRLLRSGDGRMCCLGIHAVACGVDRDLIEDQQAPYSVYREVDDQYMETGEHRGLDELSEPLQEYLGTWLSTQLAFNSGHTKDATDLMGINDSREYTNEDERVADMQRIMNKYGIELVFLPHQ